MAPEVARRRLVTNRPALDCYALGCIYHELAHSNTGMADGWVTEEDPYMRLSENDSDDGSPVVIVRHAFRNFEPCIAPGVPAALAALLRSLLAVDPAERPSVEDARMRLAALGAASVTWIVGVVPPATRTAAVGRTVAGWAAGEDSHA